MALLVRARFNPAHRHKPGEMNPTEAAYATEILEPLKRQGQILEYWFEEWKWRLKAKGTWYCPDFVVMKPDGVLEAHEVKGRMEEDAWLKLKLFAALYPLQVFIIRKGRRKAEGWDIKTFEEEAGRAPLPD